jgi:subtilisin family serine protease
MFGLVQFKAGVPQSSIDSLLDAYSLKLIREPGDLQDFYTIEQTVSSPADIFDIGNGVFESGLTDACHPNRYGGDKLCFFPDDEYFHQQWALYHDSTTPGKIGADIDMHEAWEFATGDPNVVVTVIDYAFDINHEDLNQLRIFAPFDAGGESIDSLVPDFDPSPPPEHGYINWAHGTCCLGLLSAVTNNSLGISGIASNAYFMPIKITDDNHETSDNVHAWGWKWAREHGTHVISYSIVGSVRPLVSAQIDSAYQRGIAIICVSGCAGAGSVSYPASLPQTFAVGSSDVYDNLQWKSNYGSGLQLLAPSDANSSEIHAWSLDVTGEYGYCPEYSDVCCGLSDYACRLAGPSAAPPQVAGVAALVKSRSWDICCDTCSPEALYDALRFSAEDNIHPRDNPGYDTLFGWGRLNAARALLAVTRGDADNNGVVNVSDATYIIAYVFQGGPAPQPNLGTGDADCNGLVNNSDAVYLIAYIFGGGPAPQICYEY